MNANETRSRRSGGIDRDESGPQRRTAAEAGGERLCRTSGSDDDPTGEGDQPPPKRPSQPACCDTAIDVRLTGSQSDLELDARWIEARLRAALTHLDRTVRAVTICIVDGARMSQLHEAHCGLSNTTDVLTFELSLPSEPLEVDVAVCLDVALRQATRRGHSIEQELLLYGLHGLLHCCGHDDHSPRGFQRMHEREDEILRAIGVTATFGTAEIEGDEESRPSRTVSGHHDPRCTGKPASRTLERAAGGAIDRITTTIASCFDVTTDPSADESH